MNIEYLFTVPNGRATIAPPSTGVVPLHTEASGTAPPDAFGPFRVLHQVGVGALGPVFRAFDSDCGRLVAVKVFQLDLAPERMHLFVTELEGLVAARLAHPAIASPLATGTDGVVAYLVQEYVPADSLDVLMRDHGLASPGDPIRVAAQLAAALDSAAALKVVHGALHPRDVLISAGDARLTGLGVAGAIEKAGVTTPLRRPYAAPERIEGGAWDRRADVFSLAAMVHEMLWGRRLTALGEGAARALTEVPGGNLTALRAAFARALAPSPADRFETAHEFATALTKSFAVVGRRSAVEARLPLDDPPVRSGPESRPVREITVEDGLRTVPADPEPDALGDLEMRAAEVTISAAARTVQLEETPLPGSGSMGRRPAVGGMGLFGDHEGDPSEAPPEGRADRRALWPVATALIVGIALGFGGGYRFGSRHVGPAPAPTATAPAGREWTEGAVNEPPKESSRVVPPRPDDSSRGGATQPEPNATLNAGKAGRLLVRSTPAGARVFVDGREQGQTPATVRDLRRGPHRLRLTRAGYADEDRRIVVTAARSTQSVTIELKRPAVTALAAARTPAPPRPAMPDTVTGTALSVDSRPGGARVFIDGKLVGTTPISVPQVGAGAHAIRLERDGYRRWSSSIRMIAGEPNRVTASLEK
jgi:hypothetical protein